MTVEQLKRIRCLLQSFHLGANLTIQTWLRLLGMVTAASAITLLGLPYLRPLQRWYNSLIYIGVTHKCIVNLHQWSDSSFLLHCVPHSVRARQEVMTTDASPHGVVEEVSPWVLGPLEGRTAHQCPGSPIPKKCSFRQTTPQLCFLQTFKDEPGD